MWEGWGEGLVWGDFALKPIFFWGGGGMDAVEGEELQRRTCKGTVRFARLLSM